MLRETEGRNQDYSEELRTNEEHTGRILEEIRLKRAALEDTVKELHHIEGSIDELKAKNRDMRTLQFEQEKRVKIIQANEQDLSAQQLSLEKDYERVKQKLAQAESQLVDSEQSLTKEQTRDTRNLDRRRELMTRMDLLSQKSLVLEKHQHEMEREIFAFVEENERIRRALYNRDLEAQRAKERNKQAIQRSEFTLRDSTSPVRNRY